MRALLESLHPTSPTGDQKKKRNPTLTISWILSRFCTSDSFYLCLKIQYIHNIEKKKKLFVIKIVEYQRKKLLLEVLDTIISNLSKKRLGILFSLCYKQTLISEAKWKEPLFQLFSLLRSKGMCCVLGTLSHNWKKNSKSYFFECW